MLATALVALALASALTLLLWYVRVYAFLSDDALSSFRYACNLAEGHGLAFDPTVQWLAAQPPTPFEAGAPELAR